MITRLKTFTMAAVIAAAAWLLPNAAQAQTSESTFSQTEESIFDRISQQEVVEMTLIANLDSLINVRKTEEYSKASLIYKDENGADQNYKLKIRPRGKFRRRVCDVPPLKFKFSKKQLKANGLNEHNDLKLVTHCLDDENFSETLVLKEYLAYQLFRELTPYSFRTQLVRITYQDEKDSNYQFSRYGFLIEDTDEMADRIGGKECDDCFGLADERFRASSERIAALFQLMIGNLDWSTKMNRNVKQIEMPEGDIVAVPYDFDFSVLVGAPYLRPNVDYNQSLNMERIFLGKSKSMKEIFGTLSYFKTKREKLIDIINDFDLLKRSEREEMIVYLDGFFRQIENRNTAAEMLFERNKAPVK